MGEESNVLHLPVRLQAETNLDVNLELINRHTIEPVTLEDVFSFSGICSNDRLDSHFTRMDPTTTLKNYAADLKTGVSLQEGHNVYINPYGRSYDGELVPPEENEQPATVRGHWYIMRGLTINGSKTDDTIRAIKAGIIRDMSVGFTDETYRCGSCGRDLFDWECPHIPGLKDEHGRRSFAWIENARLREVSTVYKGSCPGAYIDKAREYVQQGQLTQQNILSLERQFNVRLDDGKRSIFMPKKEEGKNMNLLEQIRTALKDGNVEKKAVYDVLSTEGESFRQPDDIQLRNELGDAATLEGVKQLKAEAEQGRQYAADLIDQAVQARVKAQGEGFDAEKYRSMLVRAGDLDFAKEEIKSWEDMAKKRFTPGRHTETDNYEEDGDDVVVSENFKDKGDDQ